MIGVLDFGTAGIPDVVCMRGCSLMPTYNVLPLSRNLCHSPLLLPSPFDARFWPNAISYGIGLSLVPVRSNGRSNVDGSSQISMYLPEQQTLIKRALAVLPVPCQPSFTELAVLGSGVRISYAPPRRKPLSCKGLGFSFAIKKIVILTLTADLTATQIFDGAKCVYFVPFLPDLKILITSCGSKVLKAFKPISHNKTRGSKLSQLRVKRVRSGLQGLHTALLCRRVAVNVPLYGKGNVGMPKNFRERAQIIARLYPHCGERMAECMNTPAFLPARFRLARSVRAILCLSAGKPVSVEKTIVPPCKVCRPATPYRRVYVPAIALAAVRPTRV